MSEQTLVSKEKLAERVREMGRQITDDLMGQQVVMICILKGAVHFFSDLTRAIDLPVNDVMDDFMQVWSYAGKNTTKVVTITKEPTVSFKGKVVLIVEDVTDRCYTMREVVDYFLKHGAAKVLVAVLFDKPSAHEVEFTPDYIGFSIGPEFIVGYGLDYNEIYRNVPEVRVLQG